MKIYIGADHRGFEMKGFLKPKLQELGYEVVDVGAHEYNPDDDDVDFARAACDAAGSDDRILLLCGSGHAMDMTANRYSSIRCILGFNAKVVLQGREHEDANALSIPAEWVSETEAWEIVQTFLTSVFSGKEKYVRRIEKMAKAGNGL